MANKYIGGSGTSRLWQRLQDSLVSLNTKLGQKANRSEIPAPYDDSELKADITNVRSLLAEVRDALRNGDIDRAIDLLDTFLIGENGGVLK